ncbi:hypothetical protein AVEN_253450-1 [Araneus ventricosus]|uniref:Tc1-like transposase DDE domain-containing protein n=1 Tax=Araneus ventricosus TaxID=182803 RepID=A0A4Y2MU94_ARAVE|nr:hypothetical protein AVEN_253450-1 [Araneus ventricosus]
MGSKIKPPHALICGGIIQCYQTRLHEQLGTMLGPDLLVINIQQPVLLFRSAMSREFVIINGNVHLHRANIVVKCLEEEVIHFEWQGSSPF